MPRRKFSCSTNYNKNRNETNVYRTRSSVKEVRSPQKPNHPSSQTQQDSNGVRDWSLVERRGQRFPQHSPISSTSCLDIQTTPPVDTSSQFKQQKLPKTSFSRGRFHSASLENLNLIPLAECATFISVSTSLKASLSPLGPELQNAIQDKIDFVQKACPESYSRILEKDPLRYSNLIEDLSHFAGGILLSEIVDTCEELVSSIKSLSYISSNSLSSSPASAKKPNLLTSNSDKFLQSEPKVKLRTLHSPSSTRTPSPDLGIDLSQLDHHNPPTTATSFPDADISTQNFLSDTSDIEGAIKEMSPIPTQELEDEEDLEVLYSRLKDKQEVPLSQRVQTEDFSHSGDVPGSLHDQVDKIRGVLSSTTPNVGQALLLLDQLQADILATELINIKPQSQRVNRQTKNQVPSRSSQVSIPPPSSSPVEPSSNPTILLFPSSSSSKNLTALLNEELLSKDFNPTNIKSIKGNGLAITFKSTKDLVNLQSKIDGNENLKSLIKSKRPAKRLPSLIVYNIPSSTKEEAIQEAIMNQLALPDPLKLRFNFRGSSQETLNWVFEASASTLQSIQKIKKLHLGWSMFKISEFYHIKRCNFCQAFGHTTKDCTHHLPSCGFCAANHATRVCLSQVYCCVNCFESNLFAGTLHPTSHPAWDRRCPFFQTEKQHYCSTRDYT
ncbi:hypothetical protein AVEN_81460-1 [Araneus ventricosus]|uniref:CCHC-type domain-containing protein n=1 Tax=Araneus ventricosus TaxID=182803 RepID=A0A4Y2E3T1_ARAVE|nr:hypothetical protein AVEN_81460-1 [Araneus ventricosus]